MIRLFFRSVRKFWACTADVKLPNVGWCGQKYGVNERISFGGLKAVLIIQYTGNAMASANTSPTALSRTVAVRLRPAVAVSRLRAARRWARGREVARGVVAISRCLPVATSAGCRTP